MLDTSSHFGPAFKALSARVRFVLAQPSHPGNIGAAARAMHTMGFGRLAVVAPRVPAFAQDEEALAFATHGQGVLRAAHRTGSLVDAIGGARLAFAMTGYGREFGAPLLDLQTAAERASELLAAGGEVAFVFGSERAGLSNEEVLVCTDCCAIAADPQCASLNLAQAVQVVAYELQGALHRSLGVAGIDPVMHRFAPAPEVSVSEVEAMVAHWQRALEVLGYVAPDDPRPLGARLRRLFARARLQASELHILRGIAAAIIEPKSTRVGKKKPDPH